MRLRKTDAPFLSLENATFRLGDRLVFEGSTWRFGRTQHWAILGPNGAGKSVFADCLCGVVPLVGGELTYGFRPPPGMTAEQAIGHVSFDERRLDVHQTVVQSRWNSFEQDHAERVEDFLSYQRVLEINPFEVVPGQAIQRRQFGQRLDRAVTLMQLQPLLKRALLSLSNGERQRVQLARALCRPIRLLILDEPFAGLDARAREHFREVLVRLMEHSLWVLLLTTRPEDLPPQVTHALWLENCRIVAAGRLRAVLKQRRSLARPAARERLRSSSADRFLPKRAQELFRLKNVTVRYADTTILDNVSWTVRAGESWALLGPNGSGKTTLLSLVLGDNPQAYKNEVTVFGRRRGHGESIWELRRRIGSVSPELQVHFEQSLTCFEVAASGFFDTIGLFQQLTSPQAAAVRKWLARFELDDSAHAPLFSLSAGLQRMVLLARALVKRPRLLLLDEPCQGLDAHHRELFVRTVDRLIRHQEVTVVYVSHRADELPPSIQRVLRLSGGKQA